MSSDEDFHIFQFISFNCRGVFFSPAAASIYRFQSRPRLCVLQRTCSDPCACCSWLPTRLRLWALALLTWFGLAHVPLFPSTTKGFSWNLFSLKWGHHIKCRGFLNSQEEGLIIWNSDESWQKCGVGRSSLVVFGRGPWNKCDNMLWGAPEQKIMELAAEHCLASRQPSAWQHPFFPSLQKKIKYLHLDESLWPIIGS